MTRIVYHKKQGKKCSIVWGCIVEMCLCETSRPAACSPTRGQDETKIKEC